VKDQYFGDINDFRKYSLLRTLQKGNDLRLLVVWMLTPNDKRNDGQIRGYLRRKENSSRFTSNCPFTLGFDDELFAWLKTVSMKKPNVRLIEKAEILPRTGFYSATVPDGREERLKWRVRMLEEVKKADWVFFDPDNGIEVKSVPFGRKNYSKYVAWDEVEAVWKMGKSILIYQHRPRVKLEDLTKCFSTELKSRLNGSKVAMYMAGAVLYLLVIQKRHPLFTL